jgi:hypothetical protein
MPMTAFVPCRSTVAARAIAVAASLLAVSITLAARGEPQAPAAGPAPARGILAVMRRDGVMIPFAAFKGARWTTPWPATTRSQELPVDMAAVPDEWWGGEQPGPLTLHLPGGASRSVALRTPRVYRAFCQTRLGILTDYKSADPIPFPPPNPYPKDGLVLPSGLDLLPIESVDRSAPETMQMARTLQPAVDRAEDQTIAMIHAADRWTHPVRAAGRHARQVTIEAWYRAPLDEPGWVASYIEATRQYGSGLLPGDQGCGLETVFTGWIHTNTIDPRKTRSQITARVTYCDRNGVKYMLPFGRIHVGGQLYWVYQSSSFGDEWYEVARMAPVKMGFVVESYGGGTRGCAASQPGL